MRQSLEAVRARLQAESGKPAYVGRAPANTTTYPFYVVDSLDDRPRRRPLAESCRATNFVLEVRASADTEGNAKVWAQRARDILSPLFETGDTLGQGRHVRHRFESSDGTYTDPDLTIPGSSTHPGFTVDRYIASTRPA